MQIRLSPDLREMIAIVKSPKTDLHARIPHGDGQTILREAHPHRRPHLVSRG
jgi:hypothetical protein